MVLCSCPFVKAWHTIICVQSIGFWWQSRSWSGSRVPDSGLGYVLEVKRSNVKVAVLFQFSNSLFIFILVFIQFSVNHFYFYSVLILWTFIHFSSYLVLVQAFTIILVLIQFSFSFVVLLFVCCLILCKHLRLSDVNKYTYLLTYLLTSW